MFVKALIIFLSIGFVFQGNFHTSFANDFVEISELSEELESYEEVDDQKEEYLSNEFKNIKLSNLFIAGYSKYNIYKFLEENSDFKPPKSLVI